MSLKILPFRKSLSTSYQLPATSRAGFTIMELVIPMALFSLVLGVVVEIFIFTSRHQMRSRSLQEANAEARTVMETIVREVQSGQIDYGYYSSSTNEQITSQPISTLALINTDNSPVRFRFNTSDSNTGIVEMCRGDSCNTSDWFILSNERLNFTAWRVWLGPPGNPFKRTSDNSSTYLSNDQPWATIYMSIQPRPVGSAIIPDILLQTTISTRSYFR